MLRGLLSLSICHSKSKVPVATLNDPALLRTLMIDTVTTDLSSLFTDQQRRQQGSRRRAPDINVGAEQRNPQLAHFAHLFPDEAYVWMTDDQPELLALVEDVTDGSERSATIVAERPVQLLVILKSTYLTCWHHTLSLDEFRAAIAQVTSGKPV